MTKAVILAAGRGTRMKDLTVDVPKPMLPAGGRPILERQLDRLVEAGYSQALIITGYHAETIEDYFRGYRLPLLFVRQTELTGTATAALLAREFVGADDFMLTYGDILADSSCYRGILERLTGDPRIEAMLAVKDVDDPFQGAAVYAEPDGRVTRIVEKPPRGQSATRWNSAGIYSFRSSIFEEVRRTPKSPRGEYELTSAVAQLLESGKRLEIFAIEGQWRDIGRPEDLAAVQEFK